MGHVEQIERCLPSNYYGATVDPEELGDIVEDAEDDVDLFGAGDEAGVPAGEACLVFNVSFQ